MDAKRIWQGVGMVAVILTVIGGITWIQGAPASRHLPAAEQQKTVSVSVSIESLYQDKHVSVPAGATALSLLETLNAEDPQMQLATQEYSGLGTLVTGMHGLKNNTDKKYWQYKVNGVMPQIGAAGYELKDNDDVEWFFGAFQE